MGTFNNKVVGIFTDRAAVDSILTDLNNLGYDSGDISILAKDSDPDKVKEYNEQYKENVTSLGDTASNAGTRLTNHARDMAEAAKTGDLIDDNNYDQAHDVTDKDPKAMVKGATAGGAFGLLAGIGLLLIPGIGPVMAAGPLAAAITAAAGGAAIGATAGTLLGLFKDEGIPNDRAEFYSNHFNNGDALIIVDADEAKKSQVREVFMKYNPNTVDSF